MNIITHELTNNSNYIKAHIVINNAFEIYIIDSINETNHKSNVLLIYTNRRNYDS